MWRRNGAVHRWVIVAALAIYALAVAAAALVAPATAPPAAADAGARSVAAVPRPLPAFVGMNVNVYHAPDMSRYRAAIDGIAAMGLGAVQIVTPIFQADGAAEEVRIIEGPHRGPSRGELADLLRYAKARGLRTSLMPQVNFTRPRGNEWRGKISPVRWDPWWRSYQQAILPFADLARETHADLFVVGCELLSTQKPEHRDRWTDLIAAARERFPGGLTYSSTWDSYTSVPFWDRLDAIGVSGYWDLTAGAADPDRPTDAELDARWAEVRDRLLAFAEAQQRPLLLTELGYPSLPWALKHPWNYIPRGVAATHEVQDRAYAAFIRAWDDLIDPRRDQMADPRVLGVLFYQWDAWGSGGADDTGYGVAGKPAYRTLHGWVQRQNSPENP